MRDEVKANAGVPMDRLLCLRAINCFDDDDAASILRKQWSAENPTIFTGVDARIFLRLQSVSLSYRL